MVLKFKFVIIFLVVLFIKLNIIEAQSTPDRVLSASKLPLNPTAKLSSVSSISRPSKSYFLGVHFKLNFFEAYFYCRRYGMQLLTLSTKEENDAVIKYLANKGLYFGKFWTSGVDLSMEGRFYWMSTGQPFRYTNWGAHEPNNGGGKEHCVEMISTVRNKYFWNDMPCDHKLHFICEQ